MVYCVNCGSKNADDAAFCMKCGSNLRRSQERTWEQRIEAWGDTLGQRAEQWGENFGEQVETECFGLPRVGAILGLIIGAVILLAGLQLLIGWSIVVVLRSLGSLVTIILGLLVIIFALQFFSRRNRSSRR